MKTSVIALVLAASMLASGCATTKRMDYQDLNYYKLDCANKDAQIRFLESQIASPDDILFATFSLNPEHRKIADRSYNALARSLIWSLRTYC